MTYKFMAPSIGPRNSNTAGLKYRAYSTYSGSASDSPDPSSLVSGSLASASGLSTQISSFTLNASTTHVWRGYFKPDATSTSWQFRTTSKDGSYLWLDTNAELPVANLNTANAIVDNGGTHSSATVESSNQSLDSDFHYVITLIGGSNTGSGNATLEWRRDGGAWSSSGATFLSSDDRYPDGLGEDTYEYANAMTRMAIASQNGYASWANLADVDDVAVWEDNAYGIHGNENWELVDIAYGKDGSGNAMYAAVNTSAANNVLYASSADFIAGNTWTEPGNVDQRNYTLLWGNNVWIAAGSLANDELFRSTDGSTWTAVDVSSLTFDGSIIRALTSDGAGNWWFGVGSKIYKSTNDGTSWSEEATITVGASGEIRDMVYTNSSVIVAYKYDDGAGTQESRAISAAASDTTDWGTALHLSSGGFLNYNKTWRAAAGNGRVVFIDTGNSMAADVSGKTLSIVGTRQTFPDEGNSNCICTDGAGTWWVGSDGGDTGADGGDICKSTDNGLSWTRTVHGINEGGDRFVEGIVVDLYLPL